MGAMETEDAADDDDDESADEDDASSSRHDADASAHDEHHRWSSREGHVDEDTWEVEALLGKRVGRKSKLEYLIKWKGWDESWNEWQVANLIDTDLVAAFDAKHPAPTHSCCSRRRTCSPSACQRCCAALCPAQKTVQRRRRRLRSRQAQTLATRRYSS